MSVVPTIGVVFRKRLFHHAVKEFLCVDKIVVHQCEFDFGW